MAYSSVTWQPYTRARHASAHPESLITEALRAAEGYSSTASSLRVALQSISLLAAYKYFLLQRATRACMGGLRSLFLFADVFSRAAPQLHGVPDI
jgi:hypothetical protein